eukprot:scaffold5852_cov100-Phaeocystis_antarctica.AAC.1
MLRHDTPSHARCLLTSISVAIAATSSGVRIWGCEKQARLVAQTMMADAWAGFNTSEASLQAQWGTWVDYAMASGSPIGVAGLEKTVVTAASFRNAKWTNMPVKLRVPKVPGGMVDGEAIANEDHSAWCNGTSMTLFSILGRSAPASLRSSNRTHGRCLASTREASRPAIVRSPSSFTFHSTLAAALPTLPPATS